MGHTTSGRPASQPTAGAANADLAASLENTCRHCFSRIWPPLTGTSARSRWPGTAGAKVGTLRAARQGVFQITEPDSTETSGYGVYDTSTIRKSVKAVMPLEYAIR